MNKSLENFLPTTLQDARERAWSECDFVYVCGDAYVDHPSFGMAIITRTLEAAGYRVGVICQPNWRDAESVRVFGRPRLGFFISSGNMDSMVNHYTVARRRRSTDAYSPGGQTGLRPDHALVVYGNLVRRAFPDVPIIIGGIEASLRRLAHYDYWQDRLKRSVLLDSQANLLLYGMGEVSVVAVADGLDAGIPIDQLTYIPGSVYRTKTLKHVYDYEMLPAWEDVCASKEAFAKSYRTQYLNTDATSAARLVEPYTRDNLYVVQNPGQPPLTTPQMDATYSLPYARAAHPSYEALGGVPAIREVKFSITSNRGCYGECAFCALNYHQGRIVQARSHENILEEAKLLTQDPEFRGYIHDVGGPTANFRAPACTRQLKHGACKQKRCLAPRPCKSLQISHADYLQLLRKLRALPGVKGVFVRSGIRFDYVMLDKNRAEFIEELARYHTSGQLRLAPEHVSGRVLDVMGKPNRSVYEAFVREFEAASARAGKEQYVLPYLMSSHPGSGLPEAVELAEFCRDIGFNPQQVQDFYPTPGTPATCMFYTGIDPRSMQRVYCAKSPHEKAMQRALIQYRNPKNAELVREALAHAGRTDLIGFDEMCLVRPAKKTSKIAQKKKGRGLGRQGSGAKPASANVPARAKGAPRTSANQKQSKTKSKNSANRKKTNKQNK